ncbi:glutamine--fructose-6-phosphate transaminase (isomerizing) [Caldinitratiruptor microaerophilus]|uniref:Glutamine--fructose-6-phosphate aminotransferase [isomerizing] n=1 Tax=Caldinitratiruptor microaerophilus TaxID=671077 RepID=A0AA35CLQ7_9FIRM|nr:glutamine--fructose-6-phosphate transaminase (isomerizing) [Caldinitratiruptor microaerophilus]BDG61650.1 glutamine--fructose-6-phosphate aminotransferase [isomerizing] [Caldinitratiruptor microaerophilus]
MCGIVGYVGQEPALPILLEGLRRLEYRGYDSAGVAVLVDGQPHVVKAVGRIAQLEERLSGGEASAIRSGTGATVGIGHTRWATHGRPSDTNSHPHTDCTGRFVVIHNGIIENYLQLREVLTAHGHVFRSETDTEVIPHLLEAYYQGDLVEAVRKVASQLHGAYALAVLCRDEPDRIVAVRLASPVVIGLGQGENFLASDIPALLPYTRRVLVLNDGEMAVLTRDRVQILTLQGGPVEREPMEVTWDAARAEKGGYAHFMLKEIHEQPQALRDTLRGRLSPDGRRVTLPEVGLTPEEVRRLRKVALVACGTASHAGLVGRYLIERLAGIPVEWDVASEYRYRDPMLGPDSLFVAISQSGETADTLAALREARAKGAKVLAIVNVVGSSIAREADWALHTWAGPEIAVASTKAYTTQLVAVTLLAVWLGQAAGRLDEDGAARILAALRDLPAQAEQVLAQEAEVQRVASDLARHDDVFFIGRGLDYAVALEGQLKLKEISYIHAEAYPAGELKHGTLALITKGVPVVALSTQPALAPKTLSNIQEVRARGAAVIAVALEGDEQVPRHADTVFTIPRTDPLVAPALAVIPLQLLAYYAAVLRGHDVDRPRNLAKSVTVE